MVGLFSVTASQQSEAGFKSLGNLSPESEWKIGTVNGSDGSVYCAMVSQYDSDTVLAFSRDRYGDNSVAVDFSEDALVKGIKYSVNMEIDKIRGFRGVERDYAGSASSNKSLVVPTGKDAPFFEALGQNGRLNISTSAVQASFYIKDFKPSYAVLMDCAGSLNNEGPNVSSVPVASVDRMDLEKDFRDRYETLESRYKSDIYLERERSNEKINILNRRYEEIVSELKKQKNNVEILRAKQKEQQVATRAMQDVINSKDAEVARLRTSQKEHLSLIEDLTRQKRELLAKEQSAEVKQRELTTLLAQQRDKIVSLEKKYKDQEAAKLALNDKLLVKEKELEELYLQKKLEAEGEIKQLQERSESLANRVSDLHRQNRKLQGQIEAAKHSARVIEDVVVSKENADLQDIILQYQKKISDLKADYEKQRIKSEGYKADINRKLNEITRLREDNQRKVSSISEEIAKQKDIEKELRVKVKKLEASNDILKREIYSAKDSLSEAENTLSDVKRSTSDATVKKYEDKLATLEKRFKDQEEIKRKLERQLKDKEYEVRRLSADNTYDQKGIEQELSLRVAELESDNLKLQDEIYSAKKALRQAEDLIAKNKSNSISEAVSKHRDRLSELESKYKAQENIKEGLERQLQEKEREITEIYEKRLERARTQVEDLLKREKVLSSKIDDLEDENHALEMKVLEAKRSAQDVRRMADYDKSVELTKILEKHQARIDELRVKADEQKMVEQQLRDQLITKEREITEAKHAAIEGKDEVIDDLVQRERELISIVERLKFENTQLEADIEVVREAFSRSGQDNIEFDLSSYDLPEIISKQVSKTSEIAEALSEAKRTYEDRLTAFNSERRDLRERIEMLELENKSVKNRNRDIEASKTTNIEHTKDMEARMLDMAKQREELKENLRAQEHQNKLLEAALKAKEESLSITSGKEEEASDKLTKVRSELMRIKSEKSALVNELEEALAEKTEQYELLRAQFDGKMAMLSKEHQIVAEIALQEETVSHLEKMLSDTEAKRSKTIRTIARLKDIERNNSDKLQSVAQDKSARSSRLLSNLTRERGSIISRLSNARAERDNIKKNMSDSLSGGSPIKLVGGDNAEVVSDIKNQLSNLEIQLASAGQQKQELSDRLEEVTRDIRDKEEKLQAEERELVSVKVMFPATRQKLEKIRTQLEKVEGERITVLGELKAKLKDKIAEYNALEKEFDKKSQLMPSISKLEIELGLTEGSIKKLEEDLAQVNAKLKKAKKDKVAAEKIIDDKQVAFAEDTKIKLATAEELAIKLDREYTKYETKLKKERKNLEDMQRDLEDVVKTNAPVKEINVELNKQLVDANKYIGDIELELQQAQTENQKLAAKIDELIEKTSPLQEYKDKIQSELVVAKSKLASMAFDLEKAAEEKMRLEAQFKSQKEVMNDLRKELEDNSKQVPKNFKKAVELELRKEEIQRLKGELIEVKARYTEAMQKVFDVQSQLSAANMAKSEEAKGVSKQLLTSEAEIYELRKRITEMEMEVAPIVLDRDRIQAESDITKARLSDLEAEMLALAQQKQQLAIRLEERNQQVFALQDELARKEQEIADLRNVLEESNRMLTEARMEMDSLKPEYQAVVNDLVIQLKNKISQYDDLQNKYNEHISAIPAISEVEAELSANRDAIMTLEEKLAEVNGERRKAKAEAIRARAALEKAYVRMESLNGRLVSPAVVNQKMTDIDRKEELQLDSIDKEKTLERAELSLKRRTREMEVETARASQRKIAETKMQKPKPIDQSPRAKKTVSKAEDFLSRVMSYHRPGDAPMPLPEAKNASSYYPAEPADLMATANNLKTSKNVDLQTLLRTTGMQLDSFAEVEKLSNNVVTQWQSERISGMYEQLPLQGSFKAQIDNYLERYRTDCTAGLKERIAPVQKAKSGNIVTADLECNMNDNSYANSIVFLEDSEGFVSIAHTAYPTEKARVRTVRDSIVRNLKRAEGFDAPVKMQRRENVKQRFKFNIPGTKGNNKVKAPVEEELDTVIIQ